MASQSAKVHDPLNNFDTHFPERLSRLHLLGDFSVSRSFQNKKNRTNRSGARYKTQPVTFDEIKEVDEDPVALSGLDKQDAALEQPKFSRSMDGLLPTGTGDEHSRQLQHYTSHSRSGSKKFQKHPSCIPESVDLEQQQPQPLAATQEMPQNRLQEVLKIHESNAQSAITETGTSLAPFTTSRMSGENATRSDIQPVPLSNIGLRCQKITAKAKKRQKALEG